MTEQEMIEQAQQRTAVAVAAARGRSTPEFKAAASAFAAARIGRMFIVGTTAKGRCIAEMRGAETEAERAFAAMVAEMRGA